MITIDNRKHEGISLREKLITLIKPSNMTKLVLCQQHELERLHQMKKLSKANHGTYIEQLYQHYIVDNKPKMYLNT